MHWNFASFLCIRIWLFIVTLEPIIFPQTGQINCFGSSEDLHSCRFRLLLYLNIFPQPVQQKEEDRECDTKCLSRRLLHTNAFSHKSHLYSSSYKWVFKWLCFPDRDENCCPQISHTIFCIWCFTCMCSFKSCFSGNWMSHVSHLRLGTMRWDTICLFKDHLLLYRLPHDSQTLSADVVSETVIYNNDFVADEGQLNSIGKLKGSLRSWYARLT